MDQTAKQQAVESIKQATNVLVTVSSNPSVDQLSAALGLTLMLSKLEKHATAVFSGQVPEAIKFLEPDKTLENNVDSLRDFIIALDKEKADKLRYKVEDNVVRIFITPYRTKITKDDFEFTQGDFNVDVVVALGVENREDLDNAITAHGRILHDSTVVTVNSRATQSKLGAVNWSDDAASSLCEMLVSVSESFGSGLLDQQISTAFLTGIVAATERFSNNLTSPKVMTMSAQLMAAGANQQLIANELQIEAKQPEVKEAQQDNEVNLRSDQAPTESAAELKVDQPEIRPKEHALISEDAPPVQSGQNQDGKTLKDLENEIASLSGQVKEKPATPASEEVSLPPAGPQGDPQINSTKSPMISDVKGEGPKTSFDEKPVLGGTFNATSNEAHNEVEKSRLSDQNNEILNHAAADPAAEQTSPTVHLPPIEPQTPGLQPEGPNVADIDAARHAVNNAVNTQPFNPSNNPKASIGAQPMPQSSEPQQIQIDENGMVINHSNESPPPEGSQPPPAIV